jgi:hypothetical protein
MKAEHLVEKAGARRSWSGQEPTWSGRVPASKQEPDQVGLHREALATFKAGVLGPVRGPSGAARDFCLATAGGGVRFATPKGDPHRGKSGPSDRPGQGLIG